MYEYFELSDEEGNLVQVYEIEIEAAADLCTRPYYSLVRSITI